MDTSSLWKGTAAKMACLPTLQTDLKVDVAIVGAGITGLTAAMLLVQAGKRVAVLDAYKPATPAPATRPATCMRPSTSACTPSRSSTAWK